MQEGVVKFFNAKKGFGFITPDGSQKDVFVHISGCIDQIEDNDKVSFEEVQSERGPKAEKVQLVK